MNTPENGIAPPLAEFQAMLEDDAGMGTVTPLPEICERIDKLFGTGTSEKILSYYGIVGE